MTITTHFVDDDWKLQSQLLRFVYVPSPHTADILAGNLLDGLMSWHLEDKISIVAMDNCRSNDGMINILFEKLFRNSILDGQLLYMRCCAHILHLVVKDELFIIEKAIERIRLSIVYWSDSQQRVENFETMACTLKLRCTKKLALDVKTRWNSTYLMLETAIEYRTVYKKLSFRDKHYTSLPFDEDWEMAKLICEKFSVFHELTKLFSGTKYPTSNVYFVQICKARKLHF